MYPKIHMYLTRIHFIIFGDGLQETDCLFYTQNAERSTYIMGTNKRVAGYARYSTDNQTENSIEFQMRVIEEYCRDNRLDLVLRYHDDALSGTNLDRPAFQQLCRDAKNHLFDAVVIYDITRGSRDVSDWFSFRKAMDLLGIEVISTQDKLGDIMDPNDFLVELLGIGIGQHHVLQTRQKTIEGTTQRALEGKFLGGIPPYGYDVVDQEYVINEKEARNVKMIFEMYASGYSYADIIEKLRGSLGKRGKPFGKSSIYSILKNDRYTGLYTWNRRNVKKLGKWAGGTPNSNIVQLENKIPQIIDRKLFDEVQIRLSRNNHRTSSDPIAPKSAKRTYLLSGYIVCEKCGCNYVGHTTHSHGYRNAYYYCGTKYRTRNCNAPNLSADRVEKWVIDQIEDLLLNFSSAAADRLLDEMKTRINNCDAEKNRIREIELKLKNATDAILNGVTYPELMEEIKKLRQERADLEAAISRSSDYPNQISKEEIIKAFNYKIDSHTVDYRQLIRKFVISLKVNERQITLSLGVVHYTSSGNPIPIVCTERIMKIS